jgi:hypothetical protein
MVHHDRHGDGVVSTALTAQRAASFNDMTMDTSDGEGHHAAVVGGASTSSAVSTTIHGDAWSPMGVASTTVADNSKYPNCSGAHLMMRSLRCNGFMRHILQRVTRCLWFLACR